MSVNIQTKSLKTVRYYLLHNRYWVDSQIVKSVLFQLEGGWEQFEPNVIYLARELCGKPYWALLEKNERLIAGSCLSHLMNAGDLPVRKVASKPNRYVVTSADVWALPVG